MKPPWTLADWQAYTYSGTRAVVRFMLTFANVRTGQTPYEEGRT